MKGRGWRHSVLWGQARIHLTLLAAAVGLALVIWFAITDTQNAIVEERLGFDLTIEVVNVGQNLATASRIPSAVITIAGRRDDVDQAIADDFVASVDLAGLAAGSHQLAVRVRSQDDDVRVAAVSPPSVEVTLEPVVQRIAPVRVTITNPPPLGFEVGEPVLVTQTVTLSGIQGIVDLVDAVIAPIDLVGATVTVRLPVSLQARTSTDAAVSGVQIDPPSVEVLIPIQQTIFRRAVAVSPDLVGQPALGYLVAGIEIDPPTVVVVGTLEALGLTAVASTTPITLTNRTADLEAVVPALPPEGLALEEETLVTVRIQVEPVTVQAVFTVAVEVVGLADGLQAVALPATVRLTVTGPAPVVAELLDASFRVTANADGLEEGVHTVLLRVRFSGAVEVAAVQPEDVRLVIEREAAAADGADGAGP